MDTITDVYFGTPVADPYRWLEDLKDSSVTGWIERQNRFTSDYFSKLPYCEQIRQNMLRNFSYDVRVPYRRLKGYAFDLFLPDKKDFWKYNPVLYYTTEHDNWIPLIDPLDLRKSAEERVVITDYSLSPDEKTLLVCISRDGSDWKEYLTVDMKTKKIVGAPIMWVKRNSIIWYKDGFFYNRMREPSKGFEHLEADGASTLYFHKLGDLENKDVELNAEDANLQGIFDDRLFISQRKTVGKTSYEIFSTITLKKDSFQQCRAKNFLIYPAKRRYDVNLLKVTHDSVILSTNLHAGNGMIARYSLDGINAFDTLVNAQAEVLTDVICTNDKLNCIYEKDFKYYMAQFSMEGEKGKVHCFSEFSTINFYPGSKSSVYYFDETSFNRPRITCYFDLKKYTSGQISDTRIQYTPREYVTRLISYTAPDGAKIPVTLFYLKGLELQKPRPVLLGVYGGFGIINNPAYNYAALLWAESGGIYALAHVRGGGEKGRDWHFAGIRTNKQKSIDDLLGVSEFLIDSGYTTASQFALTGASNGGMMVAAAAIQKPWLYKAVMADVGIYDMLRYHKFTSGRNYIDEYGCSDDSTEFKALRAYSPLHRVKSTTSYPAFLLATNLFDDRVPPFHSFKLAAALQACKNSQEPVLIYVGSSGGHNNLSGNEGFKLEAFNLAFLFDKMNIQPRFIK